MKRKAFRISVALVVILTAAFFYINNVFLPIQFRQIVIDRAHHFFGREVTLGEITCNPFKGCSIYNLTIYEKDSRINSFIEIEKLSFNILLPPILKNQKIIIPSITIDQPKTQIIKFDENNYNITDIIENTREQAKNKKKDFQFLIGSIQLNNGKIVYYDKTLDEQPSIIFDKSNFSMKVSLNRIVKYVLETSIPETGSSIFSKGEYNITKQSTTASLQLGRIDLVKFNNLFYNSKKIKLHNGTLKKAFLNAVIDKDTVDITGSLDLSSYGLQFSDDMDLGGDLSSQLFSLKVKDETYSLTGDFKLDNTSFIWDHGKKFTGDITATAATLNISKDKTDLKTALTGNDVKVRLSEHQKLTGNIVSKNTSLITANNITDLASRLEFSNIEITLYEGTVFTGSPVVSFKLHHNPEDENPTIHSAAINLTDGTLIGIPKVEKIEHAKGLIHLLPGKLKTDNLHFLVMGATLALTGELTDLTELLTNINFSASVVDLALLKTIIPEQLKDANLSPSGSADVRGHYRGKLTEPDNADINITAQLINATLSLDKIHQQLSNLNGKLHYIPGVLSWKNMSGQFYGTGYTLNGSIDFDKIKPHLETRIEADKTNLNININFLHSAMQIASFTGNYHGNNIDIKGDGHFPADEEPSFNLRADLDLDLSTLPNIFPKEKETLTKLKLDGRVKAEALFRGQPKNWRDWQLVVNAKSPSLGIYGYHINEFSLQFDQRDRFVNQFAVSARPYDGRLNLAATFDLGKPDVSFQAQASLQNAQLEKIKEDTPINDKDISGTISAHTTAAGNFQNIKELKGEGQVVIQGGQLWQFNVFQGLWKLLVIPEYEKITFTDAGFSFVVEDEKAKTTNLALKSKTIDLLGSGWIGFNKRLDFHISPRVKQINILKSNSVKKGPTSILAAADNYISIHLTGSLDQPKYSVDAKPKKIFNNATESLIDGLHDIFKGVF